MRGLTIESLRETIRRARFSWDGAAAKAHELLMSLLTPEQRREYEASRTITLYSGQGRYQQKYQLRYEDLQVKVFDHKGKLFENWCGYVPNAPREDTLIAQLLAIRNDPGRLRRAAQVTRMREDGVVLVWPGGQFQTRLGGRLVEDAPST